MRGERKIEIVEPVAAVWLQVARQAEKQDQCKLHGYGDTDDSPKPRFLFGTLVGAVQMVGYQFVAMEGFVRVNLLNRIFEMVIWIVLDAGGVRMVTTIKRKYKY
ncbi:hypothetical protein CEXT_116191 [Caerostris extrusa]|uniref:Uncharacterized protein n=1 Tax=Caerostris extrusa TaxID=172846 RepID=A0AAV4Y2W3_CAEEX|nr:hypothetical protein CEXT_116191 [Caerostris extrusa]